MGQIKKLAFFFINEYFIPKKGFNMNKDDIIKMVSGRTFISQAQAAEILEVSANHISTLVKKRKLEAFRGGKTPKPYLDAVLSYKTNPKMKRNVSIKGNNNIIGNGNNLNIKK